MKLDRLVFVNWGHMASGTYEMGNLTLLTGPTGAGKSTMLDAMQVVLTAAPDGQVKFPHPWPPQIPPGRTTRL